jgi:hypothetical protein
MPQGGLIERRMDPTVGMVLAAAGPVNRLGCFAE